MADMFEAGILCEDCDSRARKIEIIKNGFKLRAAQCPDCGKRWYHPADLEEYKNFSRLKGREFQVKIRLVGNSFCVSIPRDIIDFQEEMIKEMNDMIRMSLESPEKLSLYFRKKAGKR